MPWAADIEIRKRVKCYVQCSGRQKRKKVIGRGSEKWPTTLGEAFSLARLFEARVEATTHKEKATTEKEDTINETTYTLTSLQSRVASLEAKGSLDASEDPNFRIQEKAVKHVRALNVAPLEMVFAGLLMRFVVNFEGVGNVTPWAADIERRKIVKCYVQGSGKGKKGYWSWQRKVVRDELG
ncbi:hypothetical protein Tco_0544235 [Tanacetum coccineum]